MWIKRDAATLIKNKAKHYPVIVITGPRQSGKSTLSKLIFTDKPYISLEDLDNRRFAREDPRRFLNQFPDGAILDEVQHCPDIFSYLQTLVDSQNKMGSFILTGSQQFGLLANITQSLAGRAGFIQLLPFTLGELARENKSPTTVEELLFKGLYPPIYDRSIPPMQWYNDYIMTYLERDIRQVINVKDLNTFQRFLQMCAARTGQLLNLSSLGNDCGISHNTAKAWISVLETSYILFLLQPHYQNFNKRIIKSPKLYFYDTGLVCALLNIQNSQQLNSHHARGFLFETWVVTELLKNRFNNGLKSNLFFWQDSQGHEIDILIDQGNDLIPIEVKAGQTIVDDYFTAISYWQTLAKKNKAWLVYAGDTNQIRKNVEIVSWQNISDLMTSLNELK